MARIVNIVPAPPGWYARWRFGGESTMTYLVLVWALVEDGGPSTKQVVGVDATGRWPGGADNEPEADFVHYVYQEPLEGQPADLFNPTHPANRG
jgi:hypothetical protein